MSWSDDAVRILVARARSGDAAAFTSLVRDVYGRVHRWALTLTGDADDADDVVQETLVRLYRYLPGYRGTARFSTWLYGITRHAAVDLRRRAWRRRLALRALAGRAPAERAEPPPAEPALDAAAALVRSFFQELPPRQRQIFDLVDLQGLAPAEAAELLGLKPVSARASLLKARRALRRRMLEAQPGLFEAYGAGLPDRS